MKSLLKHIALTLLLIVAFLVWSVEFVPPLKFEMSATAEAVVGRPATPVSYAGVARRTTVRRTNRGGPVNRVGRR